MSNLHKLNFEKTFLDIAQIVDIPGKKKKITRKTESSDPAYKSGEKNTSSREEEKVSSTMDKTNISNISPEKEKNFESSANNVYNYQKKSFAQVVKGNSLISKTNRAIQGNQSKAMCYDALGALVKDSNSYKQTKNIKKLNTIPSAMDKTNVPNISSEKEKDLEASVNNVYSYQKKSFAQVVKGNSLISKTNRAIQGNQSKAMCYDALRTLNKDSNSEKQTKNIKKSDNASFPHTDTFDEGTMAVYIKVGCLMTLLLLLTFMCL